MKSFGSQFLRTLGVLAALLLLGAGIAAAQEHLGEDEVDCLDEANAELEDCTDEGDDAVDCDDDANAALDECTDEGTEDEVNEDEVNEDEVNVAESHEGPPEGTHGALVSEAAKDHSNDERCGNHGAWVSSVARGLDDCEVPPGLLDRNGNDIGADDGDDSERGGPPAHAGPPAGVPRGGPNAS